MMTMMINVCATAVACLCDEADNALHQRCNTKKYIAPKTKKHCTKDALHNSNRTNEAPPKMPMHSIPKVHIYNTRVFSKDHRRAWT